MVDRQTQTSKQSDIQVDRQINILETDMQGRRLPHSPSRIRRARVVLNAKVNLHYYLGAFRLGTEITGFVFTGCTITDLKPAFWGIFSQLL